MATEETTDAPVDEEVDEEVSAEAHTADPVPGAVTEDTPEPTKKQKAAASSTLPPSESGFVQLANTDNVEELGLSPGTRVNVLSVETEIDPESKDPYHPIYAPVDGGEVVVRTRDAQGTTVSVTADDLEEITPGGTKG